MPQQIIFFRKNRADFEKSWVSATASEGNAIAGNVLDRSNRTAWGTSGSVDANNTTLTINMGDVNTTDSILLLKHNLKSFKLQYWDDVNLVWLDFATPIAPTNNAAASNYFSFPAITTSQIKLTIFGTMTPNADKTLCQFIVTTKLGQLQGWPIIKKPTLSRNLVESKMLSGKSFVLQNVGFYSASLEVANWSSDADLTIVESLYNSSEGFLYWPCGGDETQFSSKRQGYRLEDVFLVRCKNELSPEWASGFYKSGQKIHIDLVEVIT